MSEVRTRNFDIGNTPISESGDPTSVYDPNVGVYPIWDIDRVTQIMGIPDIRVGPGFKFSDVGVYPTRISGEFTRYPTRSRL
jgi:hypothetical protein